MRYFERAARGSGPPERGRWAALPAAAAKAAGCRLCAARRHCLAAQKKARGKRGQGEVIT